jgi:hypothetical protein
MPPTQTAKELVAKRIAHRWAAWNWFASTTSAPRKQESHGDGQVFLCYRTSVTLAPLRERSGYAELNK